MMNARWERERERDVNFASPSIERNCCKYGGGGLARDSGSRLCGFMSRF